MRAGTPDLLLDVIKDDAGRRPFTQRVHGMSAPRVAVGPGHAPLPARTARTRPGPVTRQTSLILGPVSTAPGCARGTLREALARWDLAHLTSDAEAVTGELVANAVNASTTKAPPGTEPRPVTIWIAAEHDELRIRVWDPDPTPPPLSPSVPDLLALHGRGLVIVSALSHQWGWHPASNGGKYTWASLLLRPRPPAPNVPPPMSTSSTHAVE